MRRTQAIVTSTRPLLLALAFGVGCATDKTEPPGSETPLTGAAAVHAEAQGNAKAAVATHPSVSPTLGGSVFAVGDYQAELAVFENGWVRGLVFDAQGKAVPATVVADFTLSLSAQSNAKPRVTLLWDAACNCFQGQAELAGSLVAKPIDVSFVVDGKAMAGSLAAYTLLPKLDLKAQADLNAGGTVEVPTPDVKAKLAAGAKAGNDAKANLSSKLGASAKAGAGASAKAALVVPKPVVNVEVKKSASAGTKPNAPVKAKASAGFSFGTK